MSEALKQQLRDNHEEVMALPGRFSLQSGKTFTYFPVLYERESYLRVERFYRNGERSDGFRSYLQINLNGTIKYFSFSTVFGSNGTDLNESRDYLADCAELLSEAFAAKVASDYDAKSGEFESLFRSERVIRAGLEKFESAKHAANTISQKDKGGAA